MSTTETIDIDGRLGEPREFRFPADWTRSTSWRRAQSEPVDLFGPSNPIEWKIKFQNGSLHRVEFFIYEGRLRAGCDCGCRRPFCAHAALLWWKWVRRDLAVVDVDADRTYLSPPPWIRVPDREVSDS
jgi:hypothetical protein